MSKSLPALEIPDRPDLYLDGMKLCTKCGESKAVAEFRVIKCLQHLGIRDSHCRRCKSQYGVERVRAKKLGVPARLPEEQRKEHDGMKPCARCGELKPIEDFRLQGRVNGKPNTTDRRVSYCRACDNAYSREWANANPDKRVAAKIKWSITHPDKQRQVDRGAKLQYLYGLTLEQYDLMRAAQDFRCGIYGRHESDLGRQLDVDHDHDTVEVRGLLCNRCNVALGHFKDDPNLVRKGLNYLEVHRG